MKVPACLLIIMLCILSFVRGQSYINPTEAFQSAGQKQLPVLLIFSGSDWCLPCMRIEKTIFSDSSFKNFASRHLVLIRADFPQRKKLTAQQVTWNENLAEEFNPQGIFPRVLLLKADKTVVTSLEYDGYSSKKFIEQIKEALSSVNKMKEYAAKAKLMGSVFEFIVTATSEQKGGQLLRDCIKEVQRIEKLLTEFSDDSETALVNNKAGIEPVAVCEETYQFLQRCKHISQLTGGAFDITSGILKKLYRFKKENLELPPANTIAATLRKTGYKKIQLLPGYKVYLPTAGMHIGFGAIGKGYAADKVKSLMQQKEVHAGVINASGDLTAWGVRPGGEPWKTGIAHPDDPSKILLWLPLNGLSIATSGNYEQYFEVNSTRYSHNIDPKTGWPVKGIKSVSVISPAAELSDALATAVTVMGVKAGLHLINHLPQTHCILVDEQNKFYNSKNIDAYIAA